ncbi:MAG: methyltransferase domain-containing protein [Chitinophagales bacterium]
MSNTVKVLEVLALHGASQGNEWFKIRLSNGQEKELTTWDYKEIYAYPHLYKMLYSDLLGYGVFEALGRLLFEYAPRTCDELRVLDVACGSGLMGKFLKEKSPIIVKNLVGVDILPEALAALQRDNPNIYNETQLVTKVEALHFSTIDTFNCLCICGGANHIKLTEMQQYLNLIEKEAYIVFNLLADKTHHKRTDVLNWFSENENLIFCKSNIYKHRNLMNGKAVFHEAFLFQKK